MTPKRLQSDAQSSRLAPPSGQSGDCDSSPSPYPVAGNTSYWLDDEGAGAQPMTGCCWPGHENERANDTSHPAVSFEPADDEPPAATDRSKPHPADDQSAPLELRPESPVAVKDLAWIALRYPPPQSTRSLPFLADPACQTQSVANRRPDNRPARSRRWQANRANAHTTTAGWCHHTKRPAVSAIGVVHHG